MVLLVTIAVSAACSSPTDRSWGPHDTGSFELAPAGRTPIKVFYAVGSGDVAGGRVVVVMHGTNRNAAEYRDSWVPLLRHHPWVVVAPEFDRQDFPGVAAYNLGGVVDDSGDPVSPSEWTFSYLEPLVEQARARSGVREADFDLFGHSAGAQFVHRYLEFVPDAPVRRAVAANAGWYTETDASVSFPYGLGDAPGGVDLPTLFARDLTVLLGSDDVEEDNLRQDDGASRQGATRIDRGQRFYEVASTRARELGTPFHWSLQVVPGVAHDHSAMSAAAADLFAR
ncbi:hypothetical protein [Pedococcus bigeumensis]|uniref:hypothetical protein n=1 Tax=Pedococcus bigeumensis TaxID=433644 RepID=UPI0031DC42C5